MRLALLFNLALSFLVYAISIPGEPVFYKGFDLSSLKILEEGGASYKDTAHHNVTRPVEDILGDGGMNTVRLR
jgi:arabinogalactan endo-1,4-beta-galactosidase